MGGPPNAAGSSAAAAANGLRAAGGAAIGCGGKPGTEKGPARQTVSQLKRKTN